jgi:hypothetical protein
LREGCALTRCACEIDVGPAVKENNLVEVLVSNLCDRLEGRRM